VSETMVPVGAVVAGCEDVSAEDVAIAGRVCSISGRKQGYLLVRMLFAFLGSIRNNTERLLIAAKITGVGGVANDKAVLET